MPIDSFAQHNAFSEAYEVLRTVDVVGHDNKRYRLEVHRVVHAPQPEFKVRCYVEENLTIQPTYPQTNGRFGRNAQDFNVWVVEDRLPWVSEPSADEALSRGLKWLGDLVTGRLP